MRWRSFAMVVLLGLAVPAVPDARTGPEERCTAAVWRAAGRRAAAELRCRAAGLVRDTAAASCVARATAGFRKAVARWKATGTCGAGLAAVEAQVDRFVATVTGPAAPPPPRIDKQDWTDARVLVADVTVDSATAAFHLPPPLELADPPTATVFVADYPDAFFGIAYREAAVLLHARDAAGPLVHCAWMAVDDDTALVLGRELLGFPKKLAAIRLEERDGRVTGTVVRKGVEVLRVEADLGEGAAPVPLFGQRFVNVMGSTVAGMQLVEFTPSEAVHASQAATATVTMRPSAWDWLGALAPTAPRAARVMTIDMGNGSALPRVAGTVDPLWAFTRFLFRSL